MANQTLPDFLIFKGFSETQTAWITGLFEKASYPSNALIFDQGHPAEFLYLLAEGKVIIRYKPYDGPPLTVANIEPGNIFGWSVALGRQSYTSSSLAVEDCEVFRLSAGNFKEMCTRFPQTAGILIRQMAGRISSRQAGAQSELLNILQSRINPDS